VGNAHRFAHCYSLQPSRYAYQRDVRGLAAAHQYRHLVDAATNQWTASEYDYWDVPTGSFINDYRIYNLTWHNWAKRLLSSYQEQYRNASTGAWYHDTRTSTAYQANDSYTSVRQLADVPGVWVNEARYTVTYDAAGNNLLQQVEEWAANAWRISISQRSLLSYTPAGEMRRAVRQAYSTSSSTFDNVQVETYGSFITLATHRAPDLEAAALYPNPTTGGVTLSLTGQPDQTPVRVDVLNALGQTVNTLTVHPQQGSIRQALSLESLPAGLYVVRLSSAEGTVTRRLVKQ
jgi:hypothetical protein